MALGCDESCLITDRVFGGADTIATAKVLAEGIKKYGTFDLIMGGALSADGATGQVGAMVAEYLDIPHVTEIQAVSYDESEPDKVTILKKFQGLDLTIKAALPTLVSVNFGANEPRLATLRTKRAAKSKPLATYTNAEMGMDPEEIGLLGSPTIVTDSFEPESDRKAEFLTGTPKELAEKLKELIETEKGKE